MQLYNQTKEIVLSSDVVLATNYFTRLKGLLGKKEFRNKAIIIKPCQQVHTWAMRFPIDVLFLNKDSQVLAMELELQPWKVSKKYKEAITVIEAEAGTFSRSGVSTGDVLTIKKVHEHG